MSDLSSKLFFTILFVALFVSSRAFSAERYFDSFSSFQFINDSTSIGKKGCRFHFDVIYGWRNFDMTSPISGQTRSMLNHVTTFVPGARYGLLNRLDVGFVWPMHISYKFANPDSFSSSENWDGPSFGDLKIYSQIFLHHSNDFMADISVIAFVTAPTGKETHFLGEVGPTGGGYIVAGLNPTDKLNLTVSVGGKARKDIQFNDIDSGSLFRAGVTTNLLLSKDLTLFAGLDTQTPFKDFYRKEDTTQLDMLAGIYWAPFKTKSFRIRGGAGGGFFYAAGSPLATTLVGADYTIRPAPRPADAAKAEIETIITLKDTCPEDPEDFVKGVDDEGCPKYYEMREVADLISVCPTRPEDYDPSRHGESCNKVFTLTDRFGKTDAEAIYVMSTVDMSERCPVSPDKFNPRLDDPGCPKYYELKEVVPLISSCPASVKGFRPGVDDEGCPKVYEMQDTYQEENWMTIARLAKKDTDTDGVPDVDDQCPAIFGPVKTGGCPVPEHVVAKLASPDHVAQGFSPATIGRPEGLRYKPAEQALPLQRAEIVIPQAPAKELTYGKSAFVEAITKKAPIEPLVAEKPAIVEKVAVEPVVVPTKPAKSKVRIRGGQIITSVPITFKFDSFEITDGSAVALGELADKIITNPKYGKVRIEGYSDQVGGKVLNKIMSQRRAEAVKNYLELHGADTSNMKIEGLGKTREFPGGREANRRVIFVIEK